MKVYLIYDTKNREYKGPNQWKFTRKMKDAKAYMSLNKAKQAISYTNWKGRRELVIHEYSLCGTGIVYHKEDKIWKSFSIHNIDEDIYDY